MDKRQQKTRARLFATILELASEHPLADLTMSQIAETAGVHRSTMYEHASSPTDLLQTALRAELAILALWDGLTPLGRNEFICWVDDAKQVKTRARRIERTCEELREGKSAPAAGLAVSTAPTKRRADGSRRF